MPSPTTTLLTSLLPALFLSLSLLPPPASAVSFDCKHISASKQTFDLSALGGPKTVHHIRKQFEIVSNTSFTLDLCAPLTAPRDEDKDKRCSTGTRICGIEREGGNNSSDGLIRDVIEVAGEYSATKGRGLEPKWTLLRDSDSHADAGREGLRGELHGGKHGTEYQKAIIEFVCDKEKEGTEGFEKKAEDARRKREEGLEEGDGKGGEEGGEVEVPEVDKRKALRFVSYKTEHDTGVLRLEWRTRYSCDKVEGKPGGGGGGGDGAKKPGWGFFTWFLIVAFLLAAAYIIFGSWLNYNRYGARGWDLIPHGDTIRDLPYIVKDLGAGLMDKLRGGGARGGYSAV